MKISEIYSAQTNELIAKFKSDLRLENASTINPQSIDVLQQAMGEEAFEKEFKSPIVICLYKSRASQALNIIHMLEHKIKPFWPELRTLGKKILTQKYLDVIRSDDYNIGAIVYFVKAATDILGSDDPLPGNFIRYINKNKDEYVKEILTHLKNHAGRENRFGFENLRDLVTDLRGIGIAWPELNIIGKSISTDLSGR